MVALHLVLISFGLILVVTRGIPAPVIILIVRRAEVGSRERW